MAQNANAIETYDVTTIREDISDLLKDISPTDTPVYSMAKKRSAGNTYVEFAELSLATAVNSNQVAEGDNPGNDAGTLPERKGTYCEIADKLVETTSTDEAVNGVAGAQKLASQIAFKVKELKRDIEMSLTKNVIGNAGSANAGSARVTAGLPTWLSSNTSRGSSGADPTVSGGVPNATATDGTQRDITEALLATVVASAWENGADPKVIVCGSGVKQVISGFSGNATKYLDYAGQGMGDRAIIAGFSVYESDFGRMSVQPNRFQRGRDCFVLDPEHIHVATLQPLTQKPLAKTGHGSRTLIATEYAFYAYHKANGIVADCNT